MTSKLFDLTGRVALVTGSSRGIGHAIARALAEAGATVVLNSRDRLALDTAQASLADTGAPIFQSRFDVTDPDAVADAVATIEAEIGPIDILVNNAGLQRRMPLEDFPLEDWKRVLATNVDAPFIVGQAVARRMIPRGRGRIINICSVTSELGRATITPYATSKGAVKMLTKSMCAEWARYGLNINGIGPGWFRTELNKALTESEEFNAWLVQRAPMGRWGELEELGGAAVFLASDASSYVNGHILYVDGGVTAVV
ncbi:glucose 1-dehydrogenase [Kaistia dalseonensis]|uniref:Gluconate 5-dehydrogenase n=1 Tax=Kaistia dalseonensis TaxID=410840 RepID=A0ABU0H8Q4_9HYPH|nr:glucose 1-dehydrogenase [Kaistia dalseonensis]MCX5495260.1 glucose 1-dehydrogenase [Kaistia dalseonensis]MDQ0437846.1 gluconate 5-dehydrogenase [Kaistia dalseonensis]